jgi:outer membrane usher protein
MPVAITRRWRLRCGVHARAPGTVVAALILLALLRPIESVEAAPADERKPAARATVIALPLVLDNRALGDVQSRISAEMELVAIEARAVVELLRPVLLPDVLKAVAQSAGADGYLTPAGIESAGIGVDFDSGRLEVKLKIPGALRSVFELSLAPRRFAEGLRFLDPAPTSAYVNLLGGFSYVHYSDTSDGGRTPLVLDFDGAFNRNGTVLESRASWREENSHPWRRDDLRLVHDFPDRRTRIAVGDVVSATDGFQSSTLAGGVSLTRNFNLQPYRRSSPAGEAAFELERDSRVEFVVNGQRVATQRLGPGRYRVRDFPFAVGSNDVQVRITDEVGRVETVRIPFVFDVAVLGVGEHDFGYALGVTAERHSAGRRYNHADQFFSAFHNLGVTDTVTLGINGQGTSEVAQGGLEARLATPIGGFRADLAGSRVVDGDRGLAARLQYRYEEPPMAKRNGRSGTAALSYRGARFASLGTVEPVNPVAYELRLVYGQRLWQDISGNIGFTRQWARDLGDDGTQADVGFSRRLSDEFSTQVVLSRRVGFGIKNDSRIFLSLSWFPLRSGHSWGASYDTSADTARLDWQYSPTDTVDHFQASASVSQEPDAKFL